MWSDPKNYPYKSGRLFLGHDGAHEIGLETERHALTVAGAGAGKGACVIIPNLLRWPHNALVIDPKGEAAEATAEKREAMGQAVHVLDPFDSARVPDRFKACYNPLDELDPDSLTIKEDIDALADGIVMRPDPQAAHWDDGAQAIIAGLIAYVKTRAPEDRRHLIEVRSILGDDDALAEALEEMKGMTECAGAAKEAYAAVFAKEGQYFVSNARKNTRWLDSKAMVNTLSHSTFSLSDLKAGKASVFLVLPANYLGQHGRFLRLFVRSGIEAMARKLPSGELRGAQCLFLLDEFFSLGYIDEIAKAAGLMRGYGLQLWPILQDIGQLVTLYGKEGSETFFGNADLHQFFGNTDPMTLQLMASMTGIVTIEEVGAAPSAPITGGGGSMLGAAASQSRDSATRALGAMWSAGMAGLEQLSDSAAHAEHQDKMAEYQQKMAMVGRSRQTPEQLAMLVQRKSDVVADNLFCVAYGSDKLLVKPAPYFRDFEPQEMPELHPDGTPKATIAQRRRGLAIFGTICGIGGAALTSIAEQQPPQDQGAFILFGLLSLALGGWFFWRRHKIK